MGRLVPENFVVKELKNEQEREVVQTLVESLSDGWWILPSVRISGARDYEMDVVLVHRDFGVCLIEVKGHTPVIREGLFYAHGRPMEPQPDEQASTNSYKLRELIRKALPGSPHFDVRYAVAFPRVANKPQVLPPSLRPEQFLTRADLNDAPDAVESLMRTRVTVAPGEADTRTILQTLAPDIDLAFEPDARGRYTRVQLDRIAATHVRALESLDMNRRVFVTGRAGTGKSRLAVAWALRAVVRNERTLLTCFNDPLAEVLHRRTTDDPHLTVGPFLRTALSFDGIPELEVDEDDSEFWNVTVPGHLQQHWPKVTERFDTIIVDEAQDFSPAWLALLTSLLDPEGPRRVLMCGDTSQAVYQRGFVPPTSDDGWVHCELARNCRNAGRIARLIQNRFGGAPPALGGPDANEVLWVEADTDDGIVEAIAEQYDRLIEVEGYAPSTVLFATLNRGLRNRLRDVLGFVNFEHAGNEALMCETVHRMKGLEFDHVVLAVGADEVQKDDLLYVGCSRAISGLTVVGPRRVAERLGLV